MNRIGVYNMLIGFVVLFLAAAGGAFIASDLTTGFLRDPEILSSWQTTLLTSAHGHTNLFAMIHILFGLSLPYSKLPLKVKHWQTFGLLAGTIAMGPGMMYRAFKGPTETLDISGLLVGLGLSAALITLISHSAGLYLHASRRG
ncbi:MAG: hypothetical protein ACOH5I_15235 [Oligoflexus sp.]